jgi:hypothetical protein
MVGCYLWKEKSACKLPGALAIPQANNTLQSQVPPLHYIDTSTFEETEIKLGGSLNHLLRLRRTPFTLLENLCYIDVHQNSRSNRKSLGLNPHP